MSTETLTAEVEINFPDGKKKMEMVLKPKYEIENCDEGKVVILNLRNGESHTGIFKGMDGDEDLMLQSLSLKHTLGYKVWWLSEYWEQVS